MTRTGRTVKLKGEGKLFPVFTYIDDRKLDGIKIGTLNGEPLILYGKEAGRVTLDLLNKVALLGDYPGALLTAENHEEAGFVIEWNGILGDSIDLQLNRVTNITIYGGD